MTYHTVRCPHPDCRAVLPFRAEPPFTTQCLCKQIWLRVTLDGESPAVERVQPPTEPQEPTL